MVKSFTIETSARHVHLNDEAVKILFGENYKLTPRKHLSQPGQYVCNERVDIVGLKSTIKNVSVIGPERSYVQVEVSLTDARTLGLNAPIRESGDLNHSASCTLIGPKGSLEIKEGLIISKRHLHATPIDAKNLNVKNGEIIWVKIKNSERTTIFGDVIVRISPNYSLAMHIDTDEANAANCCLNAQGEIIKIWISSKHYTLFSKHLTEILSALVNYLLAFEYKSYIFIVRSELKDGKKQFLFI